jgi:hypothetical protein
MQLDGQTAHQLSRSGLLEISLQNIHQLFNSLDPSPFYDRDLDTHAENFLVSWAQELSADTPLRLHLHLKEWPTGSQPEIWIRRGIHNYFMERARLTRLAYSQLLRQGRISLAIGLVFLLACLLLGQLLITTIPEVFQSVLRESLTIVGWVAMWRPLEIYLYDWWPLRQQESMYRRLGQMPVDLKQATS